MSETKQKHDCSIHVDTHFMDERIFRYPYKPGFELASAGLQAALRLIEKDPSLTSAELKNPEDKASLDVIVKASEANAWMSPSAELPQLDRQALMLQRLGSVSLESL